MFRNTKSIILIVFENTNLLFHKNNMAASTIVKAVIVISQSRITTFQDSSLQTHSNPCP